MEHEGDFNEIPIFAAGQQQQQQVLENPGLWASSRHTSWTCQWKLDALQSHDWMVGGLN